MTSQAFESITLGDPNGTACFVSDAHIGAPIPGHEERENHLIAFLRSLSPDTATLFIIGDLFDFWIEYRHAIRPDYFPLLHELRLLIERGIEIHYIAGNHDFALGPFLSQTIGLHLHGGHVELLLQGKRLHLYHGDGLLTADVGYRALRSILRYPPFQRLYRLLHPDIGVPLGGSASGSSRKMMSHRVTPQRVAEYRTRAKEYLDRGSDIVVFGHSHKAELVPYGEKIYCNTGEWIRRYTFARMESGTMRLCEYLPNGEIQELEANRSK